ncbi:MAG: hypothetical protein ACI9TH_001176 [Kiritimatiellia bacterium]|jgi:hypothetical protein
MRLRVALEEGVEMSMWASYKLKNPRFSFRTWPTIKLGMVPTGLPGVQWQFK